MQRKNTTQRKKHVKDKKKLWNLFDNEIKEKTETLEQLYSISELGNKEKCDLCDF